MGGSDEELAELERLRNLTEEERRMELQKNPKVVTNKAAKGKYKFLQKYYHRGAFYLDNEEDVLKRDTTGATLEDRFDKTVLPKVMQVKNFGRSSRTKYTHLVDQDTTALTPRGLKSLPPTPSSSTSTREACGKSSPGLLLRILRANLAVVLNCNGLQCPLMNKLIVNVKT